MKKKRILSGMRPTGKLHLGHLVGALGNWAVLQDDYECFFMVADWHALMSEYVNPSKMKEYVIDNVVDWISCGVSVDKSAIFVQSDVGAHLDLFAILSCLVPLGWLQRCPTYKEQLRELKQKEITTYGFLGYPVLQAADILIYQAECVPIGEDQLPHLELTREIARRFNSLYKTKVLRDPQPLLTSFPRFLGLDGRKMSKSYDNCIYLSDSKDLVKKKTMSMITDPKRIKLTDNGHPDKCNVCSYYKVFAPELKEEVAKKCSHAEIGCTDCKRKIGDILIERLSPIQEKRNKLLSDKQQILDIINKGNKKANQLTSAILADVKKAMGL
ncbi:MAG TPA: tryptophan--tRNA ligase [Candidatus Omnitrophica bacterium]|nr:tryptophan--tRNA ligase [Candidatus Omnitrophota bacterium]